jgi:peptidyl-tRNA hydrolase, PTH1 family
MRLIVGLGNPGPRYARHRHNIGFMAVDAIARRHGFPPFRAKFKADFAEGMVGGEKLLVLKPQTFMNASGEAVAAAAGFYRIAPAEICVIHDELDLAPGKLRVKRGGGAAGHNGLRSIDALFGNDYWRLRLGIGHPGAKELVHGYVLQNFPPDEMLWVEPLLEAVAEALPLLVAGDTAGFATKAALILNPPAPKQPRSTVEPEAGMRAGEKSGKGGTGS